MTTPPVSLAERRERRERRAQYLAEHYPAKSYKAAPPESSRRKLAHVVRVTPEQRGIACSSCGADEWYPIQPHHSPVTHRLYTKGVCVPCSRRLLREGHTTWRRGLR